MVSVIQVIEIFKLNVLKNLLCTVILKDRIHTLLVKNEISHIFCYNSVFFTIVILPKCKELSVIHHLLKIHYFLSYENKKNYILILYSSWSLSFLQCGSSHNQLPLLKLSMFWSDHCGTKRMCLYIIERFWLSLWLRTGDCQELPPYKWDRRDFLHMLVEIYIQVLKGRNTHHGKK